MNLNQYSRQAFVTAVMDDVPSIDYCSQFHNLVNEDLLVQAPTKQVYECLKDPKSKPYVLHPYGHFEGTTTDENGRMLRCRDVDVQVVATFVDYEPSADAAARLRDILLAAQKQANARKALEAQVTSAIGACRTLRQAHERLPEFAKYLPEVKAQSTMLPAIANLAAELVKAGWPKGAVAA